MAVAARPNTGIKSGWANGDSSWDTDVNKNWNVLDAMFFLTATFAGTPPGTPVEGDVYKLNASSSGAWLGHDHEIAVYSGGTWAFIVPKDGWRVLKKGSSPREYHVFDGTAWAIESGASVSVAMADLTDVDLTGLADGKALAWNATTSKWVVVALLLTDAPSGGLPYRRAAGAWELVPVIHSQFHAPVFGASAVLTLYTPEMKTQYPVNFAGSVAVAEVAPSGSNAVFDIQKNGTSVGTLTFSVGNRKGVFAAAATTTIDPGATTPDQLKIVAPASPNMALAGVSIMLKGTPVT